MAALQLRGGTHLVVVRGQAEPGDARFDLVVDDLAGYRAALVDSGVEPADVERRGVHCRFTIIDPGGATIRVHDSHVVGPA